MRLKCKNNELDGTCHFPHLKLGVCYEFIVNSVEINTKSVNEYTLEIIDHGVARFGSKDIGFYFTDYGGSVASFYIWNFFLTPQESREIALNKVIEE